jgi:hypothetical protein
MFELTERGGLGSLCYVCVVRVRTYDLGKRWGSQELSARRRVPRNVYIGEYRCW